MTKTLQYFLIALLLPLTSVVSAQEFSIEPSEVSIFLEAWQTSGSADSKMHNNSDSEKTYTWEKHVIFVTEGWDVSVCDNIQCHPPTVDTYETLPIEPDSVGALKAYLFPNNIEGSAAVRIDLWETENPDVVLSGMYYVNTSVGVSEKLSEAIAIYPNPAKDFIQIAKSEKSVEQFELYDMSGKQALSVSVRDDLRIDVSNLPAGSYIARMFDNAGDQVSSNVLIKQ